MTPISLPPTMLPPPPPVDPQSPPEPGAEFPVGNVVYIWVGTGWSVKDPRALYYTKGDVDRRVAELVARIEALEGAAK